MPIDHTKFVVTRYQTQEGTIPVVSSMSLAATFGMTPRFHCNMRRSIQAALTGAQLKRCPVRSRVCGGKTQILEMFLPKLELLAFLTKAETNYVNSGNSDISLDDLRRFRRTARGRFNKVQEEIDAERRASVETPAPAPQQLTLPLETSEEETVAAPDSDPKAAMPEIDHVLDVKSYAVESEAQLRAIIRDELSRMFSGLRITLTLPSADAADSPSVPGACPATPPLA